MRPAGGGIGELQVFRNRIPGPRQLLADLRGPSCLPQATDSAGFVRRMAHELGCMEILEQLEREATSLGEE